MWPIRRAKSVKPVKYQLPPVQHRKGVCMAGMQKTVQIYRLLVRVMKFKFCQILACDWQAGRLCRRGNWRRWLNDQRARRGVRQLLAFT